MLKTEDQEYNSLDCIPDDDWYEKEEYIPPSQKEVESSFKGLIFPNNKFKIVEISQPIVLENKDYFKKKKYQIKIFYIARDNCTKIRQYTVRFGNRKQEDYIDKYDEKIKLRRQLQYFQCRDKPFTSGYWSLNLCNNNYNMMVSFNEVYQKIVEK